MKRALLLILFFSLSSFAELEPEPFDIKLQIDLPLTIGSFAVATAMDLLVKPELQGPYCGLACSSTNINKLDQTVIGNTSHSAIIASDVLVVSSVSLPFVLGLGQALLSNTKAQWERLLEDVLIVAETLSLNFLLNDIVKYSVRRHRPMVYDKDYPLGNDGFDPRQTADATLSFYSLHSSFSFAAATSYSYLFTKRHKDSPWVLPVWIGTHTMASAVAVLRVQAGKHFWTDVIVGFLAGSAVGLLVPFLHETAKKLSPRVLAFARPVLLPNGVGLSAAW